MFPVVICKRFLMLGIASTCICSLNSFTAYPKQLLVLRLVVFYADWGGFGYSLLHLQPFFSSFVCFSMTLFTVSS